jgi:hypothetical protein
MLHGGAIDAAHAEPVPPAEVVEPAVTPSG